MSNSANIRSLDAVRQFMSAVLQFQSEARICLAAFETQLNRIIFWLERERPEFWKREIENCMRDAADARVRLHQCRMRRIGDFRPSCFEEIKDLEQARRNLQFSQQQIPLVRKWRIAALHEANEFHGRSAQLVQLLERDVPRLLRLLQKAIERIETYAELTGTDRPRHTSAITRLAAEISRTIHSESADSPPAALPTAGTEGTPSAATDPASVAPDPTAPDAHSRDPEA